jgi:hypothetical protein
MIDLGLWISYILFGAALAGMLFYSVINMLRDPKKAKATLIGVGVLVALFLVSFLFSGNEVLPKYEQLGISAGQSKMIGAGLILLYTMGVATLVLAVYSEFRKIFNK